MPINPILQELNKISPTNNILSILQKSNNPQELVNNILANNPQLTQLINQYGNGDPRTAFYEYARLNGQDPQAILDLVRRFM